MTATHPSSHVPPTDPNAPLNCRVRDVVRTHFDPEVGTPFWLDRAAKLKVDALDRIHTAADLALLGDLTPTDLQHRPLLDYLPRALHGRLSEMVIAQTGSTTGAGTWTAYLPDEFHEAFVAPFLVAARHVGFPHGEPWLFIGPSGPHIIARAAEALARATGSAPPFAVDFDPRWAAKLPPDSLARTRYMEHIVEQAMRVIVRQTIGVLFATPPILLRLAELMTEAQRKRIRGVHYGGMAVERRTLDRLQHEAFPNAVHLSGYGNTLLGCCLELNTTAGRTMDYFPYSHRLLLETVDDDGHALPVGEPGRLRVTRLDHTMLIVRLTERDQTRLIPPPADAPPGFHHPGIRAPRPFAHQRKTYGTGLY